MGSKGASWYALPAWLVAVAGWTWFLIALVYFTDAACPCTAFCALTASGFVLGCVWLLLTGLWSRRVRWPACLLWFSVPLVGLLAWMLMLTGWGLRLRVLLSETALSERAAKTIAAGLPGEEPAHVGLFQVEEVCVYGKGVYFFTTWSYLNRHGVAYLPPGTEPAPRIGVRHLFGPWYRFEWRF